MKELQISLFFFFLHRDKSSQICHKSGNKIDHDTPGTGLDKRFNALGGPSNRVKLKTEATHLTVLV